MEQVCDNHEHSEEIDVVEDMSMDAIVGPDLRRIRLTLIVLCLYDFVQQRWNSVTHAIEWTRWLECVWI